MWSNEIEMQLAIPEFTLIKVNLKYPELSLSHTHTHPREL